MVRGWSYGFLVSCTVALAACGDGPIEPPPETKEFDLSGVWDFTEALIISSQLLVCRDTGSFTVDQQGASFSATGGLIGTCRGLIGTIQNSGGFVITDGQITDSTVSFTLLNGCGCAGSECRDARYVGTISEGPPLRLAGASACSINFDGSWEASPAGPVASVALEPDSVRMVVDETVYLTPVMRSASGARVFERVLEWSSSDLATVVPQPDGGLKASGVGSATATVAVDGLTASANLTTEVVAFTSVTAGAFHTCGLAVDGRPYCWGMNDWGQVGPEPTLGPCGGVPCRWAPSPVPVPSGLAVIRPGFQNTCGLAVNGTASCWGVNSAGQLGVDLTTTFSPMPVAVAGGFSFQALDLGANHACGTLSDGTARCWGFNNRSQLGVSSASELYSETPLAVSGQRSFAAVTAGDVFNCAIGSDGVTYCWGGNFLGELGVGSPLESADPLPVAGGLEFAVVNAGAQHACALSVEGEAYCWGRAEEGQLGVAAEVLQSGGFEQCGVGPGNITQCWEPVKASGGLTLTAVSTGGFHTCGVGADGAAFCWGAGGEGQLGNGGTSSIAGPVAVVGGYSFTSIASGREHTCALATDGLVYCWGSNSDGQLGTAELGGSSAPRRVVGQQ